MKMEEDKAAAVGKAYLSFDNTEFILKYNPFLMKEEYMRKALDEFYREKAKEHLVKLTEYWAEKMGLSYNKITFKKAAKRWGSCSSKGNIMFNYEAVKLPVECVEYLAVHELSHLIHHNHSKIFWKLVEKNLPDYKDIKKKMRQYLPESP
ncbi:MAG: hypothetical protein C0602_02415 [Denitrovibrio sp.]|nr:MAG: hypothetical protein C0602_02415 [Denitrovibrio sp.]